MSEKSKKMSVKIPARASVWYLAVSVITKGIGVLTTPFFTRLLDGEAYGNFALYMTLLGVGSVICSAFNSGSAMYRGLEKSADKKGAYLRSSLAVSAAVSLLFCLLLFAFSPFLELNPIHFLPLSLQLLCDGTTAVLLSSERYYYKYKTVAAVSIISAGLPPALSIGILLWLGGGYAVRIYSLLLVSAGVALFSLRRIIRRGEAEGLMLTEAVRFSLPMLPHTLSTAVTAQADKLIINLVMGAEALGKYSVIFSMGIVLQFIVNAIGSALSPWIIRRLEAGEGRRIAELVTPMTLGYSALVLCLMAIAPEALAVLAPPEYLQAFPALLPIALSTPFFFLSTVATVGIVHSGKAGYSLLISTAGGLTCVILNYMLIGKLGYLGAGLAFLICQVLLAALSTALLKATGGRDMISIKKVALPLLISMPIGVIIYMLRGSLLARAAMLMIPAFMLLYCLKQAKDLIIEKGGKTVS